MQILQIIGKLKKQEDPPIKARFKFLTSLNQHFEKEEVEAEKTEGRKEKWYEGKTFKVLILIILFVIFSMYNIVTHYQNIAEKLMQQFIKREFYILVATSQSFPVYAVIKSYLSLLSILSIHKYNSCILINLLNFNSCILIRTLNFDPSFWSRLWTSIQYFSDENSWRWLPSLLYSTGCIFPRLEYVFSLYFL